MPTDTKPVAGDLSSDPFISQLRDTLTKQSGAISSTDSNIESTITQAIAGVKKSAADTSAATTSSFDRQIGYQQDKNSASVTAFGEASRGYATNNAAFKQLVEYNDKSVKDLEQRKSELLLQGDAAASSQISQLILSKLDFENKAAQQTFSNMLSLGTFAIQENSQQMAKKAQDFTESQAISSVALKYGIPVQPGDTMDSITKKAAPFASAEEKLAMDAQRSIINKNNADAAKALADAKANKPLDDTSITALARAYMANPGAVTGVVKSTEQLGQILAKTGEITLSDMSQSVADNKTNGVSKATTIQQITTSDASADMKVKLIAKAESVYGPDSAQKKASSGIGNPINGLEDWFKGIIGEPIQPHI